MAKSCCLTLLQVSSAKPQPQITTITNALELTSPQPPAIDAEKEALLAQVRTLKAQLRWCKKRASQKRVKRLVRQEKRTPRAPRLRDYPRGPEFVLAQQALYEQQQSPSRVPWLRDYPRGAEFVLAQQALHEQRVRKLAAADRPRLPTRVLYFVKPTEKQKQRGPVPGLEEGAGESVNERCEELRGLAKGDGGEERGSEKKHAVDEKIETNLCVRMVFAEGEDDKKKRKPMAMAFSKSMLANNFSYFRAWFLPEELATIFHMPFVKAAHFEAIVTWISTGTFSTPRGRPTSATVQHCIGVLLVADYLGLLALDRFSAAVAHALTIVLRTNRLALQLRHVTLVFASGLVPAATGHRLRDVLVAAAVRPVMATARFARPEEKEGWRQIREHYERLVDRCPEYGAELAKMEAEVARKVGVQRVADPLYPECRGNALFRV